VISVKIEELLRTHRGFGDPRWDTHAKDSPADHVSNDAERATRCKPHLDLIRRAFSHHVITSICVQSHTIRPRNSASWRPGGLAEQLEFVLQLLPALAALRVKDDAIGGADENALRFLEIANAFGAFVRIDDEDVFARMDGFIGALGLACIAVDAIGRYQ
jgi:hypothetical protein